MADEARALLERLVAWYVHAPGRGDSIAALIIDTRAFLDRTRPAPEIRVSRPVKRDDGPPRLLIAIEDGVFVVDGHWHKELSSVVEKRT